MKAAKRAVIRSKIPARGADGRWLPSRPQPVAELIERLGGKRAVAARFRVVPGTVSLWSAGELSYRSAGELRREAWRLGMVETERHLAEIERQRGERWLSRNYVSTCQLFAMSGQWNYKGRRREPIPAQPPVGMRPEQIEMAKKRLQRRGWTLIINMAGELRCTRW